MLVPGAWLVLLQPLDVCYAMRERGHRRLRAHAVNVWLALGPLSLLHHRSLSVPCAILVRIRWLVQAVALPVMLVRGRLLPAPRQPAHVLCAYPEPGPAVVLFHVSAAMLGRGLLSLELLRLLIATLAIQAPGLPCRQRCA